MNYNKISKYYLSNPAKCRNILKYMVDRTAEVPARDTAQYVTMQA